MSLGNFKKHIEKHIENNELTHFTSVLKNFQVLISLYASPSTSQSTYMYQLASQLVACSRLSVSGVDQAGMGRAGSGEKNRRAQEGEPVNIVLKTSFRPLLKR